MAELKNIFEQSQIKNIFETKQHETNLKEPIGKKEKQTPNKHKTVHQHTMEQHKTNTKQFKKKNEKTRVRTNDQETKQTNNNQVSKSIVLIVVVVTTIIILKVSKVIVIAVAASLLAVCFGKNGTCVCIETKSDKQSTGNCFSKSLP